MNDWMIWAAQLGITLLLGALSWFVKRSYDQQHDREQQQEDRIKEVDDKVNAMRNYLSDEFVKKSDFQRTVAAQDRKLDRILEEVLRIQSK